MSRLKQFTIVCSAAAVLVACKPTRPTFAMVKADHSVSSTSAYPLAVDPIAVGGYSADTKSGAGYFYDDVLEYRVWLHPECGAAPLNGINDYFLTFAQYEKAEEFSRATAGAENPLVLARQLEWIDEPEDGLYIPKRETRITEWQVKWLAKDKRTSNTISEFLKHPNPIQREAEPQEDCTK